MYVVSYVPVHSMPETTKLVERLPSPGAQANLFSLSLSPTQNHSFVFLIFSISEDIFHSLFASAVDHSYFAAEALLSHPSDVSPLPQPLDVEDSVEFVVINFSKAILGPSSQVQKRPPFHTSHRTSSPFLTFSGFLL